MKRKFEVGDIVRISCIKTAGVGFSKEWNDTIGIIVAIQTSRPSTRLRNHVKRSKENVALFMDRELKLIPEAQAPIWRFRLGL